MEMEYRLKKILGSTTLRIKKCSYVSNNDSILAFRKKYSKETIIKGFTKNLSTGLFPLCNIPIDPEKTDHQVYYCEIAIGNCLYASKVYAEKFPVPPGFDTYIVEDDSHKVEVSQCINKESTKVLDKESTKILKNESIEKITKELMEKAIIKNSINKESIKVKDINNESIKVKDKINKSANDKVKDKINKESKDSESINRNNLSFIKDEDFSYPDFIFLDENTDIHKYSYLIKDNSRILPLYKVSFEYDRKMEMGKKNKCEMCKNEQSIMFCLAERASLCKNCDYKLHGNELTMRHKRYYFSEIGKKKFMNCPYHSEIIVDFFCINCNSPVCTSCRITGNHANTTHKLINYLEASELIRKKLKNIKNLEMNSKNFNIENMKDDIFRFKTNVEYLQKKIEEEYKRAMRELKLISIRQCQTYNADMLKYLKFKEEIRQSQSFIRHLDDESVIKDFSIIEKIKGISTVTESSYKPLSLSLNGELIVEKGKNLIVRNNIKMDMDAYIESRDK